MADVLVPFLAVGLAELGDKTQLSILLLSSKTTKQLHLLLGVSLAFLVVDGFAVLVGSWITSLVPASLLKLVSGSVFIIFGALTLRSSEEVEEGRSHVRNSVLSGFTFTFLTEWGDKTQIASALFATKYNALMVLIGAMTALILLSIAAISLGRIISNKIDRGMLTKVAGISFILIGASFFFL